MKTPFLTREEFNAHLAAGKLQPDALFPILDYDFCKRVWETSPLIAFLDEAAREERQP